jgi:Raf kinase inhibitor-like YbhB/YbcL family protein
MSKAVDRETFIMALPNISALALATSLCASLVINTAHADGVFTLSSPAFADNGTLVKKNGGISANNPNCRGDNISPPLSWTKGPEGTKSYVLIIWDPEGRMGTGVTHWLAYGIPADITSLKEGEASAPSPHIVGGTNNNNTTIYFGPCPGPNTGAHHYVISLIATDLDPHALKEGLTRDDVMKEIQGHGKAVTAMVARMAYQ